MKVDTALGDIADRITILRLKVERFKDPDAISNARRELQALLIAWADEELRPLGTLPQWKDLCTVNAYLWEAEEALRACEANKDFGKAFIETARSVYKLNDRRAGLKREINVLLGSPMIEEKSYGPTL